MCDLEYGLRGYSQFPSGKAITDGVVLDYTDFGIAETRTLDGVEHNMHYRVLTHEIGHWFGLFHIWGDNFCGNDRVEDTPTQYAPHRFCFNKIESCDSYDLTVNYMDYVPYGCMVMFTKGQKKRAMLAIKLFKKPIVDSGVRLTRKR